MPADPSEGPDGGRTDPGAVPAIGVFVSGGGRTLVNLLEAIDAGRLRARVAVVLANRECPGAERARGRGIRTLVHPGDPDAATMRSLFDADRLALVALAGYLRRVAVPAELAGRVLNIHPALLPGFGGPGMYGRRVHEAVLRSAAEPGGPTESGCTVHICDNDYDRGEILDQRRCPILPGDTPETLAARVFELECGLYPEVIARRLAELGSAAAVPLERGGPAGPGARPGR